MKKLISTAAAVLMVGVLAGCSSDSGAAPTTVELKTENMAFSSKEITVQKGQPVKLVLNNPDAMLHDFSIDKMPVKVKESHSDDHGHDKKADLHVAADAGKTGTVEFTPKEAGEYTFYCTVPGHKDAGMVGKLIVQ